jgi:DNA-binding XRE family transcriptional regulator
LFVGCSKSLGATLRRHRTAAGLTQAALADLLQTDRKRIVALEAGQCSVKLDLALRAGKALGLEFHLVSAG